MMKPRLVDSKIAKKLLSKKMFKKKMKKLKIKNKEFSDNVNLALVAFVFIVCIFLYMRYQNKKKST